MLHLSGATAAKPERRKPATAAWLDPLVRGSEAASPRAVNAKLLQTCPIVAVAENVHETRVASSLAEFIGTVHVHAWHPLFHGMAFARVIGLRELADT